MSQIKVPASTSEYEKSIRRAKELLVRLKKGKGMLEEAVSTQQHVQAQKVIRLWNEIANELFTELEVITLIHQHYLTGSTVLLKADGSLVKVEDIAPSGVVEMDPWLLLSMEKLHAVFGDDIKEYLEIKGKLPQ